MSSALHFSPAFKPSTSLPDALPSPQKTSKKRKRCLGSLEDNNGDGGGERIKADSTSNRKSLLSEPSNMFGATSLAAPDVGTSRDHSASHFQLFTYTKHEGSHVINGPRPFPHHITETTSSMGKGQMSCELATLNRPLYFAPGRVPTASAEKSTGGTGLRQHHLKTMTAVLHRCLLGSDHIRAGRAWAMLLRAEQQGQSMDLRTHDRWGVGAEILMQRELQIAQKTLDHKVGEASNPKINFGIQLESMENAKEYYERVALQYPYRKAFPNALGPLNFSIAMFSLWIYTVKERSPIALRSVASSNKDIDEADAEASFQSSSASDVEPDQYRKHENVRRDSLKSAHEIAARLDDLLKSPPYSDNAKLWKLCGEISLWIADLSVPTVVPSYGSSFREENGDLSVESSTLSENASRSTSLSEQYSAGQEQQAAFAKAEEAFQRVKICGKSLVE